MKKQMTVVAVLAASMSVNAESWGTRSGAVTIADSNTVEIANSDIAFIHSNVTSIAIGEGASVIFTGNGTLTNNFPVSGTGAFIANGGGTVVLKGDNSGLVSPGHFVFTNSLAKIQSEFGLGGKATGPAIIRISPSDDTTRLNYSPRFGTTTGVITNHVALHFSGNPNFGSESENATLVQDASVLQLVSGAFTYYMKGITRFISGTFTGTSSHLYMYNASNYSGARELWMEESSKYVSPLYNFGGYQCSTKVYFSTTNTVSASKWCGGFFYCLRENAITSGELDSHQASQWDLGGFDQKLSKITTVYGPTSLKISSDTPAKLRFTSSSGTVNFQYPFKMFAGFKKDQNDTITMTALSDSQGELEVTQGTLIFGANAGWSDGTITVTGGVLVCSGVNSSNTGKARMYVDGVGKLSVADGVRLILKSCRIHGIDLEEGGVYTLDSLAGQYPDNIQIPDGQTGSGVVEIVEIVEWTGWPDAPQSVKIPASVTVTVTDEDVVKLANATSIVMKANAMLVFSNVTERAELSAAVSNGGAANIRVVKGASVVMNGNLSGYTGYTTIEDTSTVIVSNRYGLGTSSTPAVTVAANANLWFDGNGLTNDVPISVLGTYSNGSYRKLQYDLTRGPFVQSGQLSLWGYTVFGDAIINGYLYNNTSSAGPLVLRNHDLYFNGGGTWNGWFQVGAGGTYHLNSAINWGDTFYAYDNVYPASPGASKFVCGTNSVLKGRLLVDPGNSFDLNGYDQTVKEIGFPGTTPTQGGNSVLFESEEPATLTLNGSGAYWNSVKFTGEASLTYSGTGTQTNKFARSISSGTLTVASGTLVFSDNAAWAGDVVVSGGLLRVAAGNLGLPPLGGKDAKLQMSVSGVLEIAEGTVLKFDSVKIGGDPLPYGYYGSQAAADAGLIPLANVRNCFTGTGILRSAKPGLMVLFR